MKPLLPVVVLLLGAALAGCSDEPEPIVAAPTASASEAATTQPAPPATEPVEKESAEEFIRRWQEAVIDMQNSGDTSEHHRITKRCKACQMAEEAVNDIYSDGRTIDVGESTVSRVRQVARSGRVYTFEFVVKTPLATVRNASGEVTGTYEGGTERFQANVARFGGTWQVVSLIQT